MKRTILVFSLIFIFCKVSAQNESVEKSVTGVQIGFLGANIYNEARLADAFVLRSQFALYPGFFGGEANPNTSLVLFPEFSLIPKYYYNLKKRGIAGDNTANNSGNYVSIDFKYISNWFSLFNTDNIATANSIGIIPTWGLRRNFSENFNYEFNIGLGYGTYLNNVSGNTSEIIYNLGIKIGYDF